MNLSLLFDYIRPMASLSGEPNQLLVYEWYGNCARDDVTNARNRVSVRMNIALVLWLGIVCGATILMTRYSNSRGAEGPAPVSWPVDSKLALDGHRPTLLRFVHPRCPCSRASLGELERLLAQVTRRPAVELVFLKPSGTPSDWAETDLWRSASAIPDVKVYSDNNGLEARRFQAETSGQTLLYDPAGRLKFQGGITLARGHAGDNPGRTALQQLLQEGHSEQTKTPVFGCSLFEAQGQKGTTVCKP